MSGARRSDRDGDLVDAKGFRVVPVVARLVSLALSVIGVLLGALLLLDLMRARHDTALYAAVVGLASPFYAPFRDILPGTAVSGYPVAWSLVIAIVAYALLHGVVRSSLPLTYGR